MSLLAHIRAFKPRRFGWLGGDVGASIALPDLNEIMRIRKHNECAFSRLNRSGTSSERFKEMVSSKSEKKCCGNIDNYRINKYIWLFGDTFIGTSSSQQRLEAVIIANSVGIARMTHSACLGPAKSSRTASASGSDPKIDSMLFYFGSDQLRDGIPTAIFRSFPTFATAKTAADSEISFASNHSNADSPSREKNTAEMDVSKHSMEEDKVFAEELQEITFWPSSGLSIISTLNDTTSTSTSEGDENLTDKVKVKLLIIGNTVEKIASQFTDENTEKILGQNAFNFRTGCNQILIFIPFIYYVRGVV